MDLHGLVIGNGLRDGEKYYLRVGIVLGVEGECLSNPCSFAAGARVCSDTSNAIEVELRSSRWCLNLLKVFFVGITGFLQDRWGDNFLVIVVIDISFRDGRPLWRGEGVFPGFIEDHVPAPYDVPCDRVVD